MEANQDAAGLARFLSRVGALKRTKRTGWLDRGVPPAEAESVADHSFRVALLAWLAAAGEPGLDRDRVLKLALVHDVAEAVTGDQPPYDLATAPRSDEKAARFAFLQGRHVRNDEQKEAKRAAEAAAMAELLADLPVPLADELAALWGELAEGSTAEARFVKEADKVEAFLQSREYEGRWPGLPVASFAAEVAEVIREGSLAALRDAVAAVEFGSVNGADGANRLSAPKDRYHESERDSSLRSE